MNAKEMFEELGYNYFKWERICNDIEVTKLKGFRKFKFKYETQEVLKSKNIKRITKKERKAIHQQKIELGWLDE